MFKDKDTNILTNLKEHINSSYFLYKICEGCDALILYERNICPNCNAYRFNTSRKEIVSALLKLVEQEQTALENLYTLWDEFV
jgi:phosphoribosylformylglycinamidine (FGAM) synthase-like amidotransferase family enzyme